MPIIEIDKSVLEEIENTIERKDKMYENQIAVTKKLTDSIEKLYEQEVKKLRNQLQQKDKEIERLNKELEFEKLKNKEVREYIEQCQLGVDSRDRPVMLKYLEEGRRLLEILDKENI